MGMQVYKYNPTEGEIALAGGVGSVSSSGHQVLGCLLHYNAFIGSSNVNVAAARMHGQALRHQGGVWANTVLGRFRDRCHGLEMVPLQDLRARKGHVLREQGWPENSVIDTIGGAACFMAFAHVDVSQFWKFHRCWLFSRFQTRRKCFLFAFIGLKFCDLEAVPSIRRPVLSSRRRSSQNQCRPVKPCHHP